MPALRLAQGACFSLELLGDGSTPPSEGQTDATGDEDASDVGNAPRVAVQCDGEPWLAPRSGVTIGVEHAGRTAVLVPQKAGDKADEVRRCVSEVLLRERDHGTLTEMQRARLAQQIATALDGNGAPQV